MGDRLMDTNWYPMEKYTIHCIVVTTVFVVWIDCNLLNTCECHSVKRPSVKSNLSNT